MVLCQRRLFPTGGLHPVARRIAVLCRARNSNYCFVHLSENHRLCEKSLYGDTETVDFPYQNSRGLLSVSSSPACRWQTHKLRLKGHIYQISNYTTDYLNVPSFHTVYSNINNQFHFIVFFVFISVFHHFTCLLLFLMFLYWLCAFATTLKVCNRVES